MKRQYVPLVGHTKYELVRPIRGTELYFFIF